MLVCNVSLRPPRLAIAADIAEVLAATDANATGNIVFATLIDDPASVREHVDAYSGEIMLEAANASVVVSAGSIFSALIVETATAADSLAAPIIAAATEAASAADAITALAYAGWDPATIASVTLSGNNLVATNTGTTSTNQGAHVISSEGKTSGKYYFEVTMFQPTSGGGGNVGVGIGTTASTYANMGNSATVGNEIFNSGNIWANGANTGINPGVMLTTNTNYLIGVAVDLTNRKIWFREGAAGNWNASSSNNPATNVGGVTIPAGTMVPFCTFGGTGGTANNVFTANFGASAFTGAVPSGFTSGWTV